MPISVLQIQFNGKNYYTCMRVKKNDFVESLLENDKWMSKNQTEQEIITTESNVTAQANFCKTTFFCESFQAQMQCKTVKLKRIFTSVFQRCMLKVF